jgi:hypothetical protein
MKVGIKSMADRVVKGILAGMSGAIVQDIYTFICKSIGFTNITYLDVAKAVLFNQSFKGFLALFVGFLGQLVIDGFWGIGFAFFIKYTSSRYYLLKGVFWGCGIWFLVRVIITKFFGLPVLGENTPQVALFFFIGASLFGLTVATILKLLNVQEIEAK